MDNRCCLFHDVMGTEFVSDLLAFVVRHEGDFIPAGLHSKDGPTIDVTKRDCMVLYDLGEFRAPFQRIIETRIATGATALGLGADLVARELELCAYGDGGAFLMHHDTIVAATRRITCVYYFSRTPRPFTGGQLRLHPWPIPLKAASREVLDVEPECDSMIMFPSILPHEVLPVRSASGRWSDRRFSLTCWLAAAK
jgi:Rps23 Pro-64 3,4-dihydroxylase Tpa1-like proline 4-hydroxylase